MDKPTTAVIETNNDNLIYVMCTVLLSSIKYLMSNISTIVMDISYI